MSVVKGTCATALPMEAELSGTLRSEHPHSMGLISDFQKSEMSRWGEEEWCARRRRLSPQGRDVAGDAGLVNGSWLIVDCIKRTTRQLAPTSDL